MDIIELIANVKKKLSDQIDAEDINIEDKSFLHKIIQATKRENFI